ncbi:ATP-grasp domain-containing protein [Streptomyces sp. 549]|uniref:carboxylate--amine ligase n=1 Tax=Streptomyces sp. 549 TaxID=3049076 RepID=UPI0024C2A71D|nr:ATP-grasp domain-containing protein [Streptomyces sp. 549]MDK1473566.1 ATP-grasp domain-containing protein [Streptomyces sp. 549]
MASFNTDVPALLVRLDRNPFHHGTLGAVRSLGRAGVEVHAVVESPTSPVCRSRHLHRAHAQPAAGPLGAPLLRTLRQVADRIGRRAVLIPMDDLSAIGVARLADRLADRYLVPRQAADLPERVADKAALASLCRSLDIPHPETLLPRSAGDAADAVRALGLPAIAKWSRPWLLPPGSGLRSTTVVRTPHEARELYLRGGRTGNQLLLQRLLPGGPGTDWFFHGCYTAGGACLIGGAGRKDRAWPLGAGLTAVGRWLPHPELEAAAHRLAAALGYRGILDLDFRLDTTTGRHHLLDFNPRPGAQFRLFTDPSGLDVVRALHLDLTGRPVPPALSTPGRRFVAENYAVLAAVRGMAHRTPRQERVPAPSTERAWFAADDPLPFLAMAAASLRRGVAKLGSLPTGRRGPQPSAPAAGAAPADARRAPLGPRPAHDAATPAVAPPPPAAVGERPVPPPHPRTLLGRPGADSSNDSATPAR